MIKNTNKINEIILLLLPFSIISGPFLSDLSISIMGLIFIYLSISRKEFFYYKNYFFILFIIWCIYLIIRSLLSENIYLSLQSSLFHFRFAFFSLSVWFIINNNEEILKTFTYSLLLSFFIVIFDAYYQYFFGYNFLGIPYDGYRLSGLFGSELIMGSFLIRLYPLLIGLIILNFNKGHLFWLAFISYILIDILVFLSGERSAFFNLIMSTIIIIVLIKKWKIMRLLAFIISSLIITGIVFLNNSVRDRMITTTINQFNFTGEKLNIFSEIHSAIYLSSFKIFQNNILFGIGPKMYRETCFDKLYFVPHGCQTHPHNTYLQLLSETGLIGAIPIIILFLFISYLFIFSLFKKIIKKDFLTDYQICLFVAVYITLWPFIPTGNFFNNFLNVIYFLPVGFILHQFNNKIKF